jgi:HEAT repeat protein
MSVGAMPAAAFRGFVPYDEAAADGFFGRDDEIARLAKLVAAPDGARAVAVSGESGVGKTSLLRAGLIPAIQKKGGVGIYVGAYGDLDAEVVRAVSRLGADPPAAGQDASEHLARALHQARGGAVLVLDHLEEALRGGARDALARLVARAAEAGGARLRLLLAVDAAAFTHLAAVQLPAGLGPPPPDAWVTVERLSEAQAADVLERTALASGIFFETGLAAVVATDLCLGLGRGHAGGCLPLDLQLVGRAIVDLRLTTIRKYQRSGGAPALRLAYVERAAADAGGAGARRLLVDLAEAGELDEGELQRRAGRARSALTPLAALKARGLVRSHAGERGAIWSLAHPALAACVDEIALADRARAAAARRALRGRVTMGQPLKLRELYGVKRHLGAALAPDEQAAVNRSLRRHALGAGVGALAALVLLVFLLMDQRRSYTLGFEPAEGGPAARVVLRLGRPSRTLFNLVPSRPRFGSIVADTGFSAASLSSEAVERIASGRAEGTLDGQGPAAAGRAVPGWLRDVLNGLRPVPRGVAKALLGDPDGVTSLKHAFSDPLARRETLEALAVIGRGGAGEDEILSAALADSAPEIRRRGVEVAAAIDRAQGGGAHGATLRSALFDKAADVRAAVLAETANLPVPEAAGVITVALRDPDAAFRRRAEAAAEALAVRAPGAAADAVQQVLQSNDGGVRRSGLALLERIAARAPAECAGALARVVANERAPEEGRVAALLVLRKAGAPAPALRPVLEKAVRPEASPRLRAAALPLYARLVEPEQAEEIARAEMKGPPAARAAGAAVWGTVAQTRPDAAAGPLKGLLYDPAPETRLEAARSYAYLKRDGLPLCDKALRDPNAEVERAAIDSAVALAGTNPYQVADMLGHAVKTVRPAVRRSVIEALGRMGDTRPAAVLAPLARTLRDTDTGTRAAAAAAFCAISKKNAAAASPYLRVAARDDHHEVRGAVAACLGDLGDGDPRGAAKIAAELAAADEAPVRTAAAESLGRIGPRAREAALPGLLKLAVDPDRGVRVAALRSLAAAGAGAPPLEPRRRADAERTLAAALAQGDAEERRVVVATAARVGLVAVLRQATGDGDAGVRLDAVKAAGTLAPPALDVVRAAVDDRANAVRAEATRILSGISGAGAREVLPIFESMLRGGDRAAREAAVTGVGDLPGAGDAGARLLGEALAQRSEALRTAAARALGRMAERDPGSALPLLEQAVRDPSSDVRSAAMPGLALAWSRQQTAGQLSAALLASEADSPRRFVALEALVLKAQQAAPAERTAARRALDHAAQSGPPLARLAAQIGRSFVTGTPVALHAFIERLLGG